MATRKRVTTTTKKKENRPAKRRGRQRDNTLPILIGLGVLVAVVLVAIAIYNNGGGGASAAAIEGVQSFANLERGHTTSRVNYAQNPPVGGAHNPAWQNCGVYTEPIPNENAVHSLEHGVIWLTYQPDLPAEQVAELQALTRRSAYRLLSPYPGLPSPVVASAWGYQLKLENADDPRLLAFIERYEQNPQGPEPGASCTGGVGRPS